MKTDIEIRKMRDDHIQWLVTGVVYENMYYTELVIINLLNVILEEPVMTMYEVKSKYKSMINGDIMTNNNDDLSNEIDELLTNWMNDEIHFKLIFESLYNIEMVLL